MLTVDKLQTSVALPGHFCFLFFNKKLRKLLVEMIFLINWGNQVFVTNTTDTTWMLYERLHDWWLTQSRLTTLQTSLIARRLVGPQTYGSVIELLVKSPRAWWSVFGRTHRSSTVGLLLLQSFRVGLLLSTRLVSSRFSDESWFICSLFWFIDE